MKTQIELLAPAKDLQYGMAAVNHGADAVYIGATKFGARSAAGNSISDIEKMVQYAHLYNAKVYVTINVVLFDDELEQVRALIYDLYNIGVDALIIQDVGIMEMDLPPIRIHASTQMHNITPEKVAFLEKCGVKRAILPREFSLNDIIAVRKKTSLELETFIHGALCVCYSGQCYMSLAINGRSGNRGECSQPCRSKYDLVDEKNNILIRDRHLLSLRDFNAADYLQLYANYGVNSFKIEGRLKDLSYVKNITAYYRQIIDNMQNVQKTSSGKTTFFFTPDPEKTFNRGYTSYMIEGHRTQMASFMTQKSIGKKIGKVVTVYDKAIRVDVSEKLNNGDGICFFRNEELDGFLVNRFENNIITTNKAVNIKKGTILYRNNDVEFEKMLQKDSSSERKIDVNLVFSAVENGFMLRAVDEDGCECAVMMEAEHVVAQSNKSEQICQQLSKLGNTPYRAVAVSDETVGGYFVQMSQLNDMRRRLVDELSQARILRAKPTDCVIEKNDIEYVTKEVDYTANITNKLSAEFYARHKVEDYELGVDATKDCKSITLMTTKYCLRYEIGQCLKSKNVDEEYKGKLFLLNNGNKFELKFDCAKCEMKVQSNKNS